MKPMIRAAFRGLVLVFLLASAAVLSAQELRHVTGTINVEVPVRVFKGDAFVDHLTIGDFEVLESGAPQTLDAVYLVKKAAIERREGTRSDAPDTLRHFYLFFELTEYDPKIREALDYFVKEVLSTGDELIFVTPVRTYRMKSDVLKKAGREQVLDRIVGILRRDVQFGNAEYLDVLNELAGLAAAVGASVVGGDPGSPRQEVGDPFSFVESLFDPQRSVEEQLQSYADCLGRLENIRRLDQAQVNALVEHLGGQSGQKELFLFYQREYIPKIDDSVLSILTSVYNERPDITQTLTSVFEFFRRDSTIDAESASKLYADTGAAIHFLYLTRPRPKVRGLTMEEHSEDIFSAFREMARATGGLMASTANIRAAMEAAVAASENYYLLYYTPKGYQADGKFRSLEVRVKGEGLRTTHRLGYIAD